MSVRRRLLGLGAAAVVLGACNGGRCGDDEPSDASTAPRIWDLEAITEPFPDDPWEVVIVPYFRDADGDLSSGIAHVYLNGDKALEMKLRDQFRQSALAPDAREGHLTLPLRFGERVPDGTDVRVGLTLEDLRGQKSNCYSVDLHFAVRSL